jgi:ribonucleotide reductase beta subunit family protein with ferritin-like domain
MDEKELQQAIVEKLYRLKYIGGRHTELANIRKGMKGISDKEIEHAMKYLVNQGIIQIAIKTREPHVSINPRRMREVHRILEE